MNRFGHMKPLGGLLAVVLLVFSLGVPTATADPAEEGVVPGPEMEAVLAALVEARIQHPGVFAQAEALSPTHLVVSLKEGQASGEDFRTLVEESASQSMELDWASTYFAEDEIPEMGRVAREALEAQGYAFQGGRLEVAERAFVAYVAPQGGSTRGIELPRLDVGGTNVALRAEIAEATTQARYSDGGQWEGGMALAVAATNPFNPGTSHCTSGFSWKKWGTGVVYGSTAEHCARDRNTGAVVRTRFFNGANPVGDRYFTCPGGTQACDTLLMRQVNSANTWGNTAWWGARNTASYLRVTAAQQSVMNVRVWVSGARSGLQSSIILNTAAVNQWGGAAVEMSSYVTTGGDSGAPWGVATTSTTMTAFGQHYGAFCHGGGWVEGECVGGVPRSAYTPVTAISAALSASLYIG